MFLVKTLANVEGICSATIKGSREDLSGLINQLKSLNLKIEISAFYFDRLLSQNGSEWRVGVSFFLDGKGEGEIFISERSKIQSPCFATIEGLREDLDALLEHLQLKCKGFNTEASEFYPSYRQLDERMVSRVYVDFLPTPTTVYESNVNL